MVIPESKVLFSTSEMSLFASKVLILTSYKLSVESNRSL
jgi:hypothetical protein